MRLTILEVSPETVLWRVHDTVGEHVTPWNALRHYGPVATCRFDPHDPRAGSGKPQGVSYQALDVPTALAERYQVTRTVVRRGRGAAHLTAWRPARTVRLLDLTGTWPIRAGASHVVNTGPRGRCRGWARAILAAWPDLDGLWHTSSMTGRPAAVLWTPAADALPAVPAFSQPLTDPGLADHLAAACELIGYRMV